MKIILISPLLILLQFMPVLGQQPTIEVLELAFEQIEKNQAGLNTEIQNIKDNIQKNDTAIQKIKQNENLGYLQRQRLESLLKESQTYSIQIEKLNATLGKQKVALQKLGRKLIKNYDLEINKLLKKLDDNSFALSVRKNQYAVLEMLRGKKRRVQENTGKQKLEHFEPNQLTIKPEDSPKKIAQKADLLKDQEDKYRKIGKQYNSKIHELRKELKLRNRIEDLVTDLALFDQQEEAFGSLDEAQNAALDELAPGVQSGTGDERFGALSNFRNVLISQNNFDFNSLNEEQLEDVITKLKADQLKAESKADSLANQANLFYQKAESIKKNKSKL